MSATTLPIAAKIRANPKAAAAHSRTASAGAVILMAGMALLVVDSAVAVESIHFGFNFSHATMTDSLRLSGRIGPAYWSQNKQNYNPEDGTPLPYAYHDGYIEDLGTSLIPTPSAMAQRWREIMTGQGDSRTGVSGASIGVPDLIILDELNSNFRDSLRGPIFREALRLYTLPTAQGGFGGSRNDIVGYLQPSVTQGTGVVSGQYGDVIYAANNYMRSLALETYATHDGFVTGIESPTNPTQYPTGDGYLATRVTGPLRNWMNAGLDALRTMPILSVSNIADRAGANFNAFLNYQFWFMANGRYSTNAAQTDPRLNTAVRNGVGSYTWAPDVDATDAPYRLNVAEVTRDAYFEAFLKWYSVDGKLGLHSLQVSPSFDAADFNFDGLVDGADLAAWRTSFGGASGGDADDDGDADGADLLIWQQQVGRAMPTAVAGVTVPEPSGLIAATVMLAAWAVMSRLRCGPGSLPMGE